MATEDRVADLKEDLMRSGTLSDFDIVCGGKTYKVHKVMLYSQSKYFGKVFSGNFKEAATGSIQLEDDDPAIVDRMINYMYQLDYTYEPKAEHETSHMMIDVLMYAIADKYDMPGLKRLALLKFTALVNASWRTAAFPTAIKAIYETTPDSDRGLRDVVIKKSAEHSQTLFKAANGFKDMLQEAPGFASDLAERLSETYITDSKIAKKFTGPQGGLGGYKVNANMIYRGYDGNLPTPVQPKLHQIIYRGADVGRTGRNKDNCLHHLF